MRTIRTLLLIAVLFLILVAVGVLHYNSSPNEVTITIDKQKGRETTERVIEKSKEVGSKIAEEAKGFERSGKSAPQTPIPNH